ncbi:cuticular protein RR-1 motif 48 precursor [Bombyx mori]|uniref:Putative cuticle protein n=1 Tax=Bombyx mori TaxID=7091 RepID=C0H6P0_BOMMO|nr:cuticular protein RR-1 motif 48 precursor [Bombyx mori]FAA00551.1 TPA: putative cuticle protein [Bombyx mori]
MRLICFWCLFVTTVAAQADFYEPQTFKQNVSRTRDPVLAGPFDTHEVKTWLLLFVPVFKSECLDRYQKSLFTPTEDVTPQGSYMQAWRPGPSDHNTVASVPAPILPKPEPWKAPYPSKEKQAAILHHKQALTSGKRTHNIITGWEGSFRFEYASDNGLAAGEVIEPDGSRVGAYQYKDPNGQVVKLKYRAGKEGFQILEGSHLPKSPEPVAPHTPDNYYQQAYAQQREQYQLQQQYNQQRPEPQNSWRQDQGYEGSQRPGGGQYLAQNWRAQDLNEDDGQYRDNEVEQRGPHSFGEGYAFAFKG